MVTYVVKVLFLRLWCYYVCLCVQVESMCGRVRWMHTSGAGGDGEVFTQVHPQVGAVCNDDHRCYWE